eukprot:6403238-Pyramimonas_sp.AAC.1
MVRRFLKDFSMCFVSALRRPETAQEPPKTAPRSPKRPPRWPQNGPRGPRWPQVGPERPPRRLPTASDGPGSHEDGPRWL